jgi:hypothetical protein
VWDSREAFEAFREHHILPAVRTALRDNIAPAAPQPAEDPRTRAVRKSAISRGRRSCFSESGMTRIRYDVGGRRVVVGLRVRGDIVLDGFMDRSGVLAAYRF